MKAALTDEMIPCVLCGGLHVVQPGDMLNWLIPVCERCTEAGIKHVRKCLRKNWIDYEYPIWF
jgi:hypothetical protein